MSQQSISYVQFDETRRLFESCLCIEKREVLSYDRWLDLPDDLKAASLFCSFYPQITLAWTKAYTLYGDEFEAVETVIQYLIKNVSRIADKASKYSPNYVYRVAYNCLYCICHDRKIDLDRYLLETPQIVETDNDSEGQIDMIDYFGPKAGSIEQVYETKEFWELVESSDATVEQVVNYLLVGGRKPKDEDIAEVKEFLAHRLVAYA